MTSSPLGIGYYPNTCCNCLSFLLSLDSSSRETKNYLMRSRGAPGWDWHLGWVWHPVLRCCSGHGSFGANTKCFSTPCACSERMYGRMGLCFWLSPRRMSAWCSLCSSHPSPSIHNHVTRAQVRPEFEYTSHALYIDDTVVKSRHHGLEKSIAPRYLLAFNMAENRIIWSSRSYVKWSAS
jgi:hypothetical protein